MPKQWPSLLAKLFPKPPRPPFTRWPRLSPPQEPFRASPRSQLRFTPRAAGEIEQGIIWRLVVAQTLLAKGKNESALAFCLKELSKPSPGSSRARHDFVHRAEFLHRAVSLFTRHYDFGAATSLCNRMVEEGYLISKKTYMVLMRGMAFRSAKHSQKILDSLLRGDIELDELAFMSILDMMLLHQHPAEDLEAALKAYSASRKGWEPPGSIAGTIIQSYSLAGRFGDAEEWLDRYRAARSETKNTTAPNCQRNSAKHIVPKGPNPYGQHSAWYLRSGTLVSTENPLYPYMALLIGYTRSMEPSTAGIQRLFARLKADSLVPDIHMYNMIIPALVRWGLTRRAFSVFRLLLTPGMPSLPDAYTFRHLFIALNPKRSRGPRGHYTPKDISARTLFHEMITVVRWPLHRRRPRPHKDIISTASFNAALGTYCAQGDYAAAWTVLALFPRYHLAPDSKTSRIVVLSLMRRMRTDFSEVDLGEVAWTDRLLGQRRSTMLETAHRMMMADSLFMVGRAAVAEMKEKKYQSYLKPSGAIPGPAMKDLELLVGLLRTSLQASLGFPRNTSQLVYAEKAVSLAMARARMDMIPRGRSERN